MCSTTIDAITRVLLGAALACSALLGWLGGWALGLGALGVLGLGALLAGGALSYALGPHTPHAKRFGEP